MLVTFSRLSTSLLVILSRLLVGCVQLVQYKEPQQMCGLLGFFFSKTLLRSQLFSTVKLRRRCPLRLAPALVCMFFLFPLRP